MKGKVTEEELRNMIDSVEYINPKSNPCLTICVIKLRAISNDSELNPFTVIGQSSCLYTKDYNEEIGKTVSYNNAFSQLWQLAGYRRHIENN